MTTCLPAYTHTHTHIHSPTGQPDSHRRLAHRVGLLCACSHMALGILVSLDQQLDKAGDNRCLLQRCMVCWAQSQIPDQANGRLKEQSQ